MLECPGGYITMYKLNEVYSNFLKLGWSMGGYGEHVCLADGYKISAVQAVKLSTYVVNIFSAGGRMLAWFIWCSGKIDVRLPTKISAVKTKWNHAVTSLSRAVLI